MARRPRQSGFLTLAVALIVAQAITLTHRIDAADHEPGQACQACLAASVLGGANVATPTLPPSVKPLPVAVTVALRAEAAPTPRHFEARAPPLAC